MSKQTGLGDRFYLAGYNLSGDIGSLGRVGGGPAYLETTGIDKSAMERLGGIRDGGIDFTAFFNDSAIVPIGAHQRLKLLPTTDIIATYVRGSTIGVQAASLVAKQIDYAPTRGDDGSLTAAVSTMANGFGLEWGTLLTAAERTDSAPTNGAGVDFAAASTFGLQAYLHVIAFTGTTVTIKLQESSDNAVGDPYADVVGGAFTAVTVGPTSERIATAGNLTVERWLRVVTTGTFSNLAFVVAVARNEVAPAF
jgi:hypothetical protein